MSIFNLALLASTLKNKTDVHKYSKTQDKYYTFNKKFLLLLGKIYIYTVQYFNIFTT